MKENWDLRTKHCGNQIVSLLLCLWSVLSCFLYILPVHFLHSGHDDPALRLLRIEVLPESLAEGHLGADLSIMVTDILFPTGVVTDSKNGQFIRKVKP